MVIIMAPKPRHDIYINDAPTHRIPHQLANKQKSKKKTRCLQTMSINPVADVKPFKTMWKIKVKVIRLWKQYSAAGGETIEMVLCDVKVRDSLDAFKVLYFSPLFSYLFLQC